MPLIARSSRALPTQVLLAALIACAACAPDGPRAAADGAPPAVALLVQPDDGTAAIIGAIRGARRRVRLAMYLLTAPEAIEALLAAHAAGRDVAVLLERTPYGAANANAPAFAALAGGGVDVRWSDAAVGLLHAKLLVVDGAVAYVLTLNFTRAGLGGNREYAIVDRAAADVARAEALWQAAAAEAAGGGAPSDGSGGAVAAAAPTRLIASGADARARLVAAIDGAVASIAIEMEELSDGEIVDHLAAAARARGVGVTVVAPAADRSAATSEALAGLVAAGARVRALGAPVVHAKAMVIDGQWFYVGSVNFTRASLDDNREVGFVADDVAGAGRVGAVIAADAARGAAL